MPPAGRTLPSRVELTTRLLLDDMAAAGVRATFLVVGWVAERYPALVREILDAGHEVGSHGHLHQRTHVMTRQAFAADLRASLRALDAAGAPAVRCFRAPEWSIDDRVAWALDELAAAGITVDGSRAPVRLVGRVRLAPYAACAADSRRRADRARRRSSRTGSARSCRWAGAGDCG